MKFFLMLSMIWSFSAKAQELTIRLSTEQDQSSQPRLHPVAQVCKSGAYIYQPFNSCSGGNNNVIDFNQPTGSVVLENVETDWIKGRKDQQALCQEVKDDYNRQSGPAGLHSRLNVMTPIAERSNGNKARTLYKYTCQLLVSQYVVLQRPSPRCGSTQARLITRLHHVEPNSGKLSCLTCDNVDNGTAEEMVSCLRANLVVILSAEPGFLSQDNVQALVPKVRHVLTWQGKVRNLNSYADAEPFHTFLDRFTSRR